MDDLLGWLFINLETKNTMFVYKDARAEHAQLPWNMLADEEILRAFRRDFGFKEVEVGPYLRLKIDVAEPSLMTLFAIREGLK